MGRRRCSDAASKASCTARDVPAANDLAARGKDDTADLGELELTGPAAQHDLVVVLEEGSRGAVGEPDRMLAVPRELDERALAPVLRPGDRPGGEQIAGRNRRPFTVACASCCGIVQ